MSPTAIVEVNGRESDEIETTLADDLPVEGTMPQTSTRVVTPTRSNASRKMRPYQQRKGSLTARSTTAPSLTITKAQEYTFIRADLRRLLLTAGVLTIIMIGLLFAIDR